MLFRVLFFKFSSANISSDFITVVFSDFVMHFYFCSHSLIDGVDVGRTQPERQDYQKIESAARRIADIERGVK